MLYSVNAILTDKNGWGCSCIQIPKLTLEIQGKESHMYWHPENLDNVAQLIKEQKANSMPLLGTQTRHHPQQTIAIQTQMHTGHVIPEVITKPITAIPAKYRVFVARESTLDYQIIMVPETWVKFTSAIASKLNLNSTKIQLVVAEANAVVFALDELSPNDKLIVMGV
jgi:hypothetical protein